MSFDPISALFTIGSTLVDRLVADPNAKAEQLFALEKLRQEGDLSRMDAQVKLLLGQIEINKIDAQSKNWFQASWRPAIGWVGAVSLALMYIPKALVMTYIWTFQAVSILNGWDGISALVIPTFPDLGVSDIVGLIMSMLGVAAMRSYDKKNGTDTK